MFPLYFTKETLLLLSDGGSNKYFYLTTVVKNLNLVKQVYLSVFLAGLGLLNWSFLFLFFKQMKRILNRRLEFLIATVRDFGGIDKISKSGGP